MKRKTVQQVPIMMFCAIYLVPQLARSQGADASKRAMAKKDSRRIQSSRCLIRHIDTLD